jgi:hypothetical protein
VKQVTKFVAFDGQEFDSEIDCRRHESDYAHVRLVGVSAEALDRAIKIYALPASDRLQEDSELAVALEDVGVTLQRARIAKREVKRERRAKVEPAIHQSDALRSLHEAAKDLHAVGAIGKATMRDFDVGCLTDSPAARDMVAEAKAEMDARATPDCVRMIQ